MLHATVRSVSHRGNEIVTLSRLLAMTRAGLKTPDRCALYSKAPPICSPGIGVGAIPVNKAEPKPEQMVREGVDDAIALLSIQTPNTLILGENR